MGKGGYPLPPGTDEKKEGFPLYAVHAMLYTALTIGGIMKRLIITLALLLGFSSVCYAKDFTLEEKTKITLDCNENFIRLLNNESYKLGTFDKKALVEIIMKTKNFLVASNIVIRELAVNQKNTDLDINHDLKKEAETAFMNMISNYNFELSRAASRKEGKDRFKYTASREELYNHIIHLENILEQGRNTSLELVYPILCRIGFFK